MLFRSVSQSRYAGDGMNDAINYGGMTPTGGGGGDAGGGGGSHAPFTYGSGGSGGGGRGGLGNSEAGSMVGVATGA